LTSKNALIPITYYLYHKDFNRDFCKKKSYEEDRETIKKWLHIVLVRRVFGGQADSVLSRIRSVFTGDVSKKKIKDQINAFPLELIVKVLKGTTKDMTFDGDYIDKLLLTQKEDSLCFSILALLYPHLDYRNGDFHKDHVFAESFFTKKKLRSLGVDEDKFELYLKPENYNSILNLQLLDGNENKSKQDAELQDWIKKESKVKGLSQKEFCDRHLLPEILEITKFAEFITARKKKLKEILLKLA
jgi:hypothetical protein